MPGLIVLLQALLLAVSGPPSSPEYLPIRVAEAEGYFSAEGLAVTIRTTRAESGAAEALAQGQADLAATTLEAILRFGLRAATNQAPRLIFGLTAAPPARRAPAGARAVRHRARAPKSRAADPHGRRASPGGSAPDPRGGRVRRFRGPAHGLARALSDGRPGLGRPAPADDLDHPDAHAVAAVGEDPAARGHAASDQALRSLTTPKSSSRRRVASTGSPITLVYEPTTPSTSAPFRSWIA